MGAAEYPVRKSPRWKDFDYSTAMGYFVTLCTHNREHRFGNVCAGEMVLSDNGRIAWECWQELPQHFPTLVLDEFVVMPNHLHAILFLLTAEEVALMGRGDGEAPTGILPQSTTLMEVIRYFKTISAKRINRLRTPRRAPVWQRSFYDHVIRSDDNVDAIRGYILRNPQTWGTDTDPLDGRVAQT